MSMAWTMYLAKYRRALALLAGLAVLFAGLATHRPAVQLLAIFIMLFGVLGGG
jgi:hypothetical protein